MKYILLISFALIMSSCKVEEIDFKGMESAKKAFNERQRKELVIFMPLETMFPDRRIRALAESAGKGKIKKVDELIARGVDVNSQGTKGATPLFWAFKKIKYQRV